MEIPSFNALIQKSIIDHWDMDALTDYKGATLQYHDVARKIEKLHIMFENSGVVKGDKIALCGQKQCQLGSGLPGYPHLWCYRRTYPARVYARADSQHREPQRCQAALCGRCRGYTDRCYQDARFGGYHLHTRLFTGGFTYRQVDLCPRAPQRDVRYQVP